MDSKKEIQHVYLVGAKSLGAYGGYETFVYKLTEYHQNKENIKYHVACKANGDGCMDETKFDGVTKINDHEFEFHNAHCFKIDVPQIGPAQAIYYDVAALKACCEHIKENHIPHPIVYIMACRIGPFAGHFYREIHKLGGTVFLNPDGHEWMRAKWSAPIRKYWKISEQMMVKYCDLTICDSVNIEKYIHECYDGKGIKGSSPKTTFIAYGADLTLSKLADDDEKLVSWYKEKGLTKKGYYLVVGRFVPENSFEVMIREFMKSKSKKDFAIITNVNEKFLNELEEKLHFKSDKRIKFVGTVYDQELLKKIRENAYAKRKNLLMGSNPIIAPDSEMLWNAAIVWRILRRYEYTGALVMGRRKKIDVNTTSVRTLPEDKWIIAENAHAAIVTKDEYYQAQKAIRNVTPIQYKVGDDFALKGKICCGNCNRQLRHERQYGEMVFYCGYKRSAGKFSKCYGGYYREYSVNAKVARAIKTVFYALDVVNQGMQEKQSITVRCMDIEDLEKQAEAIRVEQIKLYESYADGVLLRDAYIEKKKALSEKLAALQDSIRTEKEEQECADELDEEIRALTKQASEKTYIGGLTKECVDAFVSMVYLYDDQTMKIEFNCEDVIRRALEKYGA